LGLHFTVRPYPQPVRFTGRPCVALLLWSAVLGLGFAPREASAQSMLVAPGIGSPLLFEGFEGGPFIPTTVSTFVVDDFSDQGLTFSVTANKTWLTLAPNLGVVVLDGTVNVDVGINLTEAANLAPGTYSATVTFTNITNGIGTTTRTVMLHVAPANFTVNPQFVNVSATEGGVNPASVTVTLTNNGEPDLNYTAINLDKTWYALSKKSGTVPGLGTDSFQVSFNVPGLIPGTYIDTIALDNTSSAQPNVQVVLTLTINPPSSGAVTLLPDTDLQVNGPEGAIPGTISSYTFANGSNQVINWAASANVPWLSITPATGEISPDDESPGGPDEQNITVRLNAAVNDLLAGSFTAQVSFKNTVTNAVYATRIVRVTVDPVLTLPPPTDGGTVSASPPGTPVPGASSPQASYKLGQVVTLTANVNDRYEFQGWAGDVPETSAAQNPVSITMNASKNVSATIAPLLYTLNLSTSGSGTGTIKPTPAGINVENALVSNYLDGTVVALQAEPDAGALFISWSGNLPSGSEFNNPLSVPMDRERTITARFEKKANINVTVVGNGTYSISPNLASYYVGLTVTLNASPAAGYVFKRWSGDVQSTNPNLTLILDGSKNIQAVFEPATTPPDGNTNGNSDYSLAVVVIGSGTVTPDGGKYSPGTSVQLVATPDEGWNFTGWEGDLSGTDLSNVVVMSGNRTVKAVFTAADSGGGSGLPFPSLPFCGAFSPMMMIPLALAGLAMAAQRSRRIRRR